MLELIENKLFTDTSFNDMFRLRVVEGLAQDSPEEALEVIESMQAPNAKALAYVHASDALPASEHARKRDMLDQAALQARGTKEPQFRLADIAEVCDRLLDLGETDRATKLLREGQTIAKEMPNAAWAAYAKGLFAEKLALIDLKEALELCKHLSDAKEFDRHHGNMAHELASKNPTDAERILSMMRDPVQRDHIAMRVCYRMARADLNRARRIARTITEPRQQAYALGVMAQALASSDKPAAAKLLAEAFDSLDQTVDAGKDRLVGRENAAVTAATLLPVAEAIDPKSVPDYFWRSLSLRLPEPADQAQEGSAVSATATLAMRLARYDRAVARVLLEPAARRARAEKTYFFRIDDRIVPVAAAAIDPRWSVELIDGMPDPPDLTFYQPKNYARLGVAHMLARKGEHRWQYLQWTYMHLWVPDKEDIAAEF